jgi:hypothetical protein
MFKKFFIVVTAILSTQAFSLSIPNDAYDEKSVQSVDENFKHESTEKLLKTFEDHFSPLVSKQGGKLLLILNWDSSRHVAEAQRPTPNEWAIVLHGGGVRDPELGTAELSLILCHELGHHLGGTPTASRTGWSACEGQADYWSGFECIKSFGKVIKQKNISTEARDWCHKNNLSSDEFCANFAQTALNVTRFYARFQSGIYPYIDSRDTNVASRIYFGHPNPQCRLDTLLSGYLLEQRPSCWYKH